MSCSEFWNTAPESELDELSNHAHARECAACSARVQRLRGLTAGLRAMAADARETGAPPRVEAQLLAAFRAARTPSPKARVLPWRLRPVWALAAAAGVLFAAGVWLVPQRGQAPAAHHRQPATVELAALDDANPSDAVLDDGFIPLPNAERLEPGDDVNVVRMALPRSAMMAVGYDVSAEAASELVEADVALGPDGLARAVRFVENASSL
jgi:hypothetical protein